MPTQRTCARFIVSLRSSASFGRMEMRSSSEESQLIVFSAKSGLPICVTRNSLPNTSCQSPRTAPANCLFPCGSFQQLRSSSALACFSDRGDRLPANRVSCRPRSISNFQKASRQSIWRPSLITSDRESGKTVAVPFIIIHDGVRIVTGDQHHLRAGVPPPGPRDRESHPSRPQLTPQSLRTALSASLSATTGRPNFSGGSSRTSARPPSSTYFLMASTSGC